MSSELPWALVRGFAGAVRSAVLAFGYGQGGGPPANE